MIVLDTNVISELMRTDSEPRVAAWLTTNVGQASTTVINQAETLAGIELLPSGGRKERLLARAEGAFARLGVLPLVDSSAAQYARIRAARQRSGRRIEPLDALIAAICLEAGATLATRNVRDFEGIGLELINPWA